MNTVHNCRTLPRQARLTAVLTDARNSSPSLAHCTGRLRHTLTCRRTCAPHAIRAVASAALPGIALPDPDRDALGPCAEVDPRRRAARRARTGTGRGDSGGRA